jgi:hypothetical protein
MENDSNIDVDVEIRDDVDAEVDVDIASLVATLVAGVVDLKDGADLARLAVDLDEAATIDSDIDVIVDLGELIA